ncbi:hypothetical protein F8144_41130 [Streptomyces triticiradicis]|uniref:Enoyl-CoA hydratase n=1 Tax=Streptomyces triticiradicis TaxID=2651189 RepID=A0A7J5D3S3_9ACTN|nr:hypothetical protein F8144_41130 [Streptomyces triticiradicis]
MEEAGPRDDIRAVALTGEGGTFSVGMDLRWYVVRLRRAERSRDASFMDDDVRLLQRVVTAVADCPKPVVALVDGECTGAALELVSACDIRYATRQARFALPEAELGIVADLCGLQRLPLLVNQGHLHELAFTGRAIDADRARRIGLVNDVYADSPALHHAARQLTDDLRPIPHTSWKASSAPSTPSTRTMCGAASTTPPGGTAPTPAPTVGAGPWPPGCAAPPRRATPPGPRTRPCPESTNRSRPRHRQNRPHPVADDKASHGTESRGVRTCPSPHRSGRAPSSPAVSRRASRS